jgi:ActR/RegA family two-component response regulator
MGAHQLSRGTARHFSSAGSLEDAAAIDDGSEQFLIASDDDRLCETVKVALARLGHSGIFLRSGIAAVDRLSARRPRLVLLDQDLRDLAGLDVARALSADSRHRFVLMGERLRTSVTVAAMKLGALTVLEKPLAITTIVALLRSVVDELRTEARATDTPPGIVRSPRSIAERWALKVLRGCEADGDLRTLGAWAAVAGLSYSSLCEICRLVGIQPLVARDLTRVLRAVVQARTHGCRIGELLDICDRRTLNGLMSRAAVDPGRHGREISVQQFLAAQRFVPVSNAGLMMLRELLPR